MKLKLMLHLCFRIVFFYLLNARRLCSFVLLSSPSWNHNKIAAKDGRHILNSLCNNDYHPNSPSLTCQEMLPDDTHNNDNNNGGIEEFGFETKDPLQLKRGESWVLVVDDEESIRRAVGQFLFDKGYQVTACPDGESALRIATSRKVSTTIATNTSEGGDSGGTTSQKVPDCIVSDIRMPGIDGLELLKRMRQNELLVEVPVVLLTAKGQIQDRIAGYDCGADAYLSKPFDPDELIAIIDNVIERHQTLNGANVQISDLKRDLDEMKYLLLEKGGGGVSPNLGFVEDTNIFLAPDEREVLELLCQGLMTKEIAAKTYLSTRRVEQLLTRMFRKTKCRNRTELVRWAVATGNVRL